MSDERICRRCLLFESGRADVLESVREHMRNIPPHERSGDEAYAARLALCRACEHLADGTCLQCGCYPEFRAAFRTQHCPKKKW